MAARRPCCRGGRHLGGRAARQPCGWEAGGRCGLAADGLCGRAAAAGGGRRAAGGGRRTAGGGRLAATAENTKYVFRSGGSARQRTCSVYVILYGSSLEAQAYSCGLLVLYIHK